MTTLPPDAVERFRQDFERTLGRAVEQDRIALAVSGGPDSMAMLALAADAFPGRVVAATVDHGLRTDSAVEVRMVAAWCAQAEVPHTDLMIDVLPGASGNLQSWARQERYNLLHRWTVGEGANILATGHHGDDQAETFLMRASRGSGVAGLAAVRACQEITLAVSVEGRRSQGGHGFVLDDRTITLLRPMLGWRRIELRALAETAGLPFVDDPSNADERFDRTRFRGWVESAPWIDPLKIARAAAHVAEAEADLRAVSQWLWAARSIPSSPYEEMFDVAELPREVRRRLARIAIDSVQSIWAIGGEWNEAANVEALLDALEAGKSATQAGVMASAKGSIWRFRAAPPRRSL